MTFFVSLIDSDISGLFAMFADQQGARTAEFTA